MPSLGADMESGTVLEWLVKPGDVVHKGDTVVVIDTEKSDIEAETFESGVIGELLVDEGTEVPVGTPLAVIVTSGPDASASPPVPATPAPRDRASTPRPTAKTTLEEPALPAPTGRTPTAAHTAGVVLSPLVRRLAADRHLDPTRLRGTGVGGVVTRADVEGAGEVGADRTRASPLARRRAREAGVDIGSLAGTGPDGAVVAADVPDAPAVGSRERKDRVRDAVAESMARSKREIPHYYLETTIDLGPALDWLRAENESRPVTERILPAALLLAATARASARHPELNGWWEGGHRPADHVHLGVAVSLRGGGLIAPGIADADRLPLSSLMSALRDLVTRARAGRLRESEYTGPTITVTNLGDLGVDSVWGVINPPQLAMVGFGAVHEAPLVVEGEVVARPVVHASLAADHRTSDGMAGAVFLAEIAELLREPDRLQEDQPK